MSVLLHPNQYIVGKPSRALDEHGWALDGDVVTGATEQGNIQANDNPPVERSGVDRDHGQADPTVLRTAQGYLEPTTTVEEGDVLMTATQTWRVASLTEVTDPTSSGVGVIVAQLQAVIP